MREGSVSCSNLGYYSKYCMYVGSCTIAGLFVAVTLIASRTRRLPEREDCGVSRSRSLPDHSLVIAHPTSAGLIYTTPFVTAHAKA